MRRSQGGDGLGSLGTNALGDSFGAAECGGVSSTSALRAGPMASGDQADRGSIWSFCPECAPWSWGLSHALGILLVLPSRNRSVCGVHLHDDSAIAGPSNSGTNGTNGRYQPPPGWLGAIVRSTLGDLGADYCSFVKFVCLSPSHGSLRRNQNARCHRNVHCKDYSAISRWARFSCLAQGDFLGVQSDSCFWERGDAGQRAVCSEACNGGTEDSHPPFRMGSGLEGGRNALVGGMPQGAKGKVAGVHIRCVTHMPTSGCKPIVCHPGASRQALGQPALGGDGVLAAGLDMSLELSLETLMDAVCNDIHPVAMKWV